MFKPYNDDQIMGYNEIQRSNHESICIFHSKSNFHRCPKSLSTFPTNYGRAFSWAWIYGLNVDILIDYWLGINVNFIALVLCTTVCWLNPN